MLSAEQARALENVLTPKQKRKLLKDIEKAIIAAIDAKKKFVIWPINSLHANEIVDELDRLGYKNELSGTDSRWNIKIMWGA